MDKFDEVGGGKQVPARARFRHVGVDRLDSSTARRRDALMAVDDEVWVAELMDDDRREGDTRESPVDRAHTFALVGSAGREIATEVGAAAVGADDVAQRDRLIPR
jgi:hypothetical protein